MVLKLIELKVFSYILVWMCPTKQEAICVLCLSSGSIFPFKIFLFLLHTNYSYPSSPIPNPPSPTTPHHLLRKGEASRGESANPGTLH